MKHLLIAGAFLLVGCASTGSPQDPQQAVFAAKAALVTAVQITTQYAQLPRCPQPVHALCSDAAVVATADKAANAAADAIQAAEDTVRNPAFAGNSDILSKSVIAAQNAVTALTAISQTLTVR